MKKIISHILLSIALFFSIQLTTTAASLGLSTQGPTLGSSFALVDYLEFGGDGDLSSFFNPIDSSNGVAPVGLSDLSLSAAFPLTSPTTGATGFFDIFDDNGLFLGGDLLAVGFTQDVIELQFDNLIGSAAGSFGSSIQASITFDDSLGSNPFGSLIDGNFYTASINIANVVPVSEPHSLGLLVFCLAGVLFYRRRAL